MLLKQSNVFTHCTICDKFCVYFFHIRDLECHICFWNRIPRRRIKNLQDVHSLSPMAFEYGIFIAGRIREGSRWNRVANQPNSRQKMRQDHLGGTKVPLEAKAARWKCYIADFRDRRGAMRQGMQVARMQMELKRKQILLWDVRRNSSLQTSWY